MIGKILWLWNFGESCKRADWALHYAPNDEINLLRRFKKSWSASTYRPCFEQNTIFLWFTKSRKPLFRRFCPPKFCLDKYSKWKKGADNELLLNNTNRYLKIWIPEWNFVINFQNSMAWYNALNNTTIVFVNVSASNRKLPSMENIKHHTIPSPSLSDSL